MSKVEILEQSKERGLARFITYVKMGKSQKGDWYYITIPN